MLGWCYAVRFLAPAPLETLLDSATVALPALVTGPVFKFTSEHTKDEEPPSDT